MTVDPFGEKSRCWSPYNYALDNPIRFIDIDGDSSVVLIAPEGAPIEPFHAGHMAQLIQDKDGKWRLWSKNGTNQSPGSSGPNKQEDRGDAKNSPTYSSPQKFMDSKDNPVANSKTGEREYTEGYEIPATEEQDRKNEEGEKEVLDKSYNVDNSNCAQAVQSGLSNEGKKDGSPSSTTNTILSIISPTGAIICNKTPKLIYKRIKNQNPGGKIFKPIQDDQNDK